MYYILENGNLKGRGGKSNCNCIAYLACVVRVSPGSYVVLQEAKVCQLPLLPGCEKFGLGARLGLVPYVPKKITIRLSASITSKVLNESK